MNPIVCLLEGNGSLAGRDRAGAFTATGSGALRYAPANGARVNHCYNPRLATGASLWGTNGGGTTSRVADSSLGGYACEVSGSSANDGLGQANFSSGLDMSAQVTVSFDAYLVSGAGDWSAFASMRNAAGTGVSDGPTSSLTITSTPTRYSFTLTPASYATGAHRITVKIVRATSVAGVIRVSNMLITNGSSTECFDGASTGAVWLDPITGVLGTANLSVSVSRATFWIEEATTNTIPDPSFEAATITTNWSAAGSAAISKVTSHAYIGSNGGKVSCTASTSDGIDQLSTSGAAASNGQAWTVSGRIRAFAAGDVGKTVKPQIVERTSADAVVATNLGSAITLTDAWQAFSYSFTLAGGGTVAKATCGFRAGAATAVDFVLDCVQLEQKAYATSYCDGTLGTGYSWSGTAHASTSTRAAARVYAAGANRINTTRGAYAALVYPTNGASTTARIVQAGSYSSASGDAVILAAATYNNVRMYFSTDTAGAGSSGAGAVNLSLNTFANPYGDWTASTGQAGLLTGALQSGSRTVTPAGSLTAANTVIDLMTDLGATSLMNGYIGPVLIYNRPLTAAERAKVNAAIDSNGAASLWTVLGSNAYRNFQLRPISQ